MSSIEEPKCELILDHGLPPLTQFDEDRKQRVLDLFRERILAIIEKEYDIGKVISCCVPAGGGYTRQTVLIMTDQDTRWVIHVYPESFPLEDVEAEVRLLEYLHSYQLPVNTTQSTRSGLSHFQVSLQDSSVTTSHIHYGVLRSHLIGHHITDPSLKTPSVLFEVGRILGRFHAASTSLSLAEYSNLLYPGCSEDDHHLLVAASASNVASLLRKNLNRIIPAQLSPELLNDSPMDLPSIFSQLTQASLDLDGLDFSGDFETLSCGIIHADCHELNILFSSPSDGSTPFVSGLLDWEDSCWGLFLIDISLALIEFSSLDPNLISSLLSGYQSSFRPLLCAELEALPRYLLYEICQAAAWCAAPSAVHSSECFVHLSNLIHIYHLLPHFSLSPKDF